MSDSAANHHLTRKSDGPLRWPVYACGSMSSVGGVMLALGIFFYTEHYFHWGLAQNFTLSAAQGVVYIAGSLAADKVAARFGRRRALLRVYLTLTILAVLAALAPTPAWLVAALLAYVFTIALTWPQLESLVTSGADAHEMSRRVGAYNLVWSGTNAVTFAASGIVIARWRYGVFIIAALMHAMCALLMWRNLPRTAAADSPAAEGHAHVQPEPELLASRTLAMWLARICMPANYVVVNGLSAMMPMLAILRPLSTAERTAVGSVWMVARFGAFLYFGTTTWWHTRPRMLLVAAAMMMVAFLGVTVRPSDVLGPATPYSLDLASMIAGQLALGAAMGMIYSASLYFGMVLSDGSTEHGGYHEALIGVGCVIGPGAAALTQIQWPGDIRAGITAVSTVIALSVLSAGIASVKASRRPTS